MLILSLLLMTIAHAQRPVFSPQIHAEQSVIFRFKAPPAAQVKIWGEWDGQEHSLAKDETGVWSVTLGPLATDGDGYSFDGDGLATLDPHDSWTKPARSTIASGIEKPGRAPVPYARQPNVAPGEVHLHPYNLRSLERNGKVSKHALQLTKDRGAVRLTWQ